MKLTVLGPAFLVFLLAGLILPPRAHADEHFWSIASPDHGQTFSCGSERNRAWAERGRDRHLALMIEFTNDPFVDRDNPREYDDFTFGFPQVRLGSDGRTFSYRTAGGRLIPVAVKKPGFLGIEEIRLLPNANLRIEKPHGYLTLSLEVFAPDWNPAP